MNWISILCLKLFFVPVYQMYIYKVYHLINSKLFHYLFWRYYLFCHHLLIYSDHWFLKLIYYLQYYNYINCMWKILTFLLLIYLVMFKLLLYHSRCHFHLYWSSLFPFCLGLFHTHFYILNLINIAYCYGFPKNTSLMK